MLQPSLDLPISRDISPAGPALDGHGQAASRPTGLAPYTVIALSSLWIAIACNYPLWRALLQLHATPSLRDMGFIVVFAIAIAAVQSALAALFAWRWTLKPFISAMLLASAAGAYFMLSYGIVIDSTMMVNVLQTDPHEASDLMSWRMVSTLLVLAGLPMVWLWRQPVRFARPARQAWHNAMTCGAGLLLAVAAILLAFQDFSSTMRNHTQLRYLINPLNSVYALGNIAAKPLRRDDSHLLPIGEDARLGASYAQQKRPPLLVLVVGETGRSGNFALNGYTRNTTPELGARHDIATALNAWSCGTNTAASVPCMFSHLGKEAYESRKVSYENLLDVLQRAGLGVLWVDNQAGCKGVCERVANVSTNSAEAAVQQGCTAGECQDTVMLASLDARIAALPQAQRDKGVVVVLHQMGSHGPAYAKRSAEAQKHFMPECTSNALQECTQQQLVNAYDNSIVATDHFLNTTIDWLTARESQWTPAMVYLADHGESLGENNIYLHGMPYAIAPDVQKHVPWITWLSPAMQARTGVQMACLQNRMRTERIHHDNYFHSVLGLMDVQTDLRKDGLDLYSRCNI